MIDVFVAALAGIVGLLVFYSVVRSEWPESYIGTSSVASYAITVSPVRYVLFHLVPVYAACVFVAVSLDRGGASGGSGAVLVASAYAFLTVGRALVTWFRAPQTERVRQVSLALFRAVVFLALVVTGIIAASTRWLFVSAIPPLSEISASLWTALFAGVLGAFLLQASRGGALSAEEVARRSLMKLPPSLVRFATEAARNYGADEDLVVAVMVVENAQRPKWFRAIERVKGLILKPGTYGIMQVEARQPLSDEDSIRQAIAERFVGVSVVRPTGIDYAAFQRFAHSYNSSRNFSDLLWGAYEMLRRSRTAR